MIRISDLFTCPEFEVPSEAIERLKLLLPKLIQLEEAVGYELHIDRAFSTWEQHKAIYRAKNDKRLIVGLSELPIPIHSKHLTGDCADIADRDQSLKVWISANVPRCKEIGLGWFEAFYATDTHVHAQQVPPASGLTFFKPY